MLKFLALGDSYTIGEGVHLNQTWPHQLQQVMLKHHIPLAIPSIVAQTGWTSEELETALAKVRLKGPYDMVTLLIGVNDQYRGYPTESFEPVYNRLLVKALKLAGGQSQNILALSIPDWGITPFANQHDSAQISASIDAFNQCATKLCQQKEIKFIDITDLTRELSVKPEMLVTDQLHPSALQYANWVEAVIPSFKTAFQGVKSN